MVIRSKNLLERYNKISSNIIKVGPYNINTGSRIVSKDEMPIDLTTREYDILIYFTNNIGLALSREQILNHIWGGRNYFGSDRVVDDLVRRLRKKMPELDLETVYGYGYRVNRA